MARNLAGFQASQTNFFFPIGRLNEAKLTIVLHILFYITGEIWQPASSTTMVELTDEEYGYLMKRYSSYRQLKKNHDCLHKNYTDLLWDLYRFLNGAILTLSEANQIWLSIGCNEVHQYLRMGLYRSANQRLIELVSPILQR